MDEIRARKNQHRTPSKHAVLNAKEHGINDERQRQRPNDEDRTTERPKRPKEKLSTREKGYRGRFVCGDFTPACGC